MLYLENFHQFLEYLAGIAWSLSLLTMHGLPYSVKMLEISLQTAELVELGSFLTIRNLEK